MYMYCFSFFSIQITDHSICNFTSFKSKRVHISNEMLLMNSLSIYKTGPAKNCASKLRCKEKKGRNWQTTKQVRWKNRTGSCIYIVTIKIEEINNYPTPSARINLIHACNKMHILHVYIYIYRIHIYSETFELCTCTIDPCVST